MNHHEFVVDTTTIWVWGAITKLEAFALYPSLANPLMVSAFAMNFQQLAPLVSGNLTCCRGPPHPVIVWCASH